jgi:hypothetical protein
MPSHDILDRLFNVEKKAEEIALAARDEADRRVAMAKEECETAFKAAYEARVAVLQAELEESKKGTDIEFRGELAAFRARLESAGQDDAGFTALCGRFLAGKA